MFIPSFQWALSISSSQFEVGQKSATFGAVRCPMVPLNFPHLLQQTSEKGHLSGYGPIFNEKMAQGAGFLF